MFDRDQDHDMDTVDAAREKAQTAKESTKEKLGPRAVDGVAQAFPEEFKRRQRVVAAKALGAGVVIGAVLSRIARR